MKLAHSQSLSTGLSLSKPKLHEAFFPVPYSNYIVVHAGGGQVDDKGNPIFVSKRYDYFVEVLELLAPILERENIKVIQIGTPTDPVVPSTLDLRGKTRLAQSFYLIKRAKLLLGTDSVNSHAAGLFNTPLVVLFGETCPKVHGPAWCDENRTILLEPDRKGRKPSFSFNSYPKVINWIKPETVANSVLKVLGLPDRINIETIYIGEQYHEAALESVPNQVITPNFFNGVLNLRLDYLFNEQNAYQQLSLGKCTVITPKPLNLDVLRQLKPNIALIGLQIDNFPNIVNYTKELQKIGIQISFISEITDINKQNERKLELCEFGPIIFQPKILQKDVEIQGDIDYNTFAKSKHLILSNGKSYISKAHLQANLPTKSLTETESIIINSPDFWGNNLWIYRKNQENTPS